MGDVAHQGSELMISDHSELAVEASVDVASVGLGFASTVCPPRILQLANPPLLFVLVRGSLHHALVSRDFVE